MTAVQLAGTRRALLADDSQAFIETMFRLNTGSPLTADDRRAIAVASDLGLVAEGHQALTPLGWLVSDSIREYKWWLERDRRIHSEHLYPLLAPEQYAGKSVVEPGSGFGCNLLSLSRVEGRFVGVEPTGVYRQLTPILAEREGLPIPDVVAGACESMPFPDAEFDRVLIYSAHQYMNIPKALKEIFRVLRPGGQLHIIGPTLDAYLTSNPMPRRLSSFRFFGLTLVNTLVYERAQVRLVPHLGGFTTNVYPRYRFMRKWIANAGLVPRDDLSRSLGDHMCFIADKPTSS
jgi:SAM-dependent methyltransferase